MPWKETHVVDQRMQLISARLGDGWAMSEVCAAAGVSRKTGYKWLARYEAGGPEALRDQSRAPQHHSNAVTPAVIAAVVAMRRAHMRWGPRKLRVVLAAQQPQLELPATSTIGALIRRQGLVRARRRRRAGRATPTLLTAVAAPNDVWCGDFKGWFRVGNGVRCDPLTVTDAYSRYLLRCEAVARPDGRHVQRVWERAFREYGLPQAIRTDNGPPFATTGLGGLSALAVWWIKLGIRPERIAPGHPEQNGRHERMHRTLREATAVPPRASVCAQQRAFDRFRREYNTERPHEALGQRAPATCYVPSARRFPRRVGAPEYPAEFAVRQVRYKGEIKWRGGLLFLSRALAGEPVGLEPVAEGQWRLYFGAVPLALIDDVHGHVIPYQVRTPAPCGRRRRAL